MYAKEGDMAKNVLADLLVREESIELGGGRVLYLRPLSLEEMIGLFVVHGDTLVQLYELMFMPGDPKFGPFLLSAPGLVAQIIAISSDPECVAEQTKEEAENKAADMIRAKMPASSQIDALRTVWSMSVPDPKKLEELLSEATVLLSKGLERRKLAQGVDLKSSPVS
jgi:hypothetical protein